MASVSPYTLFLHPTPEIRVSDAHPSKRCMLTQPDLVVCYQMLISPHFFGNINNSHLAVRLSRCRQQHNNPSRLVTLSLSTQTQEMVCTSDAKTGILTTAPLRPFATDNNFTRTVLCGTPMHKYCSKNKSEKMQGTWAHNTEINIWIPLDHSAPTTHSFPFSLHGFGNKSVSVVHFCTELLLRIPVSRERSDAGGLLSRKIQKADETL